MTMNLPLAPFRVYVEMHRWCERFATGRWTLNPYDETVWFESESDATMFRLRWL